jgi:hypothetical protein
MAQDERPVSINISAIPVAGVGGLGLVAMAGVVSVFFPAIGWMMAAGAGSGILLAVALVAFRRIHKAGAPSGDNPVILFRDVTCESHRRDTDSADRPIARSPDHPISRSPDHPITRSPDLLHSVIRRFLRDDHVVDVAFTQTRGADADHLRFALQRLDVLAAGVPHPGAQAPHQLMDHRRD